MTKTKTTCDLCGKPKPEAYKLQEGWANVYVTGSTESARDFCKSCWSVIEKTMLASFVSNLMGSILEKT